MPPIGSRARNVSPMTETSTFRRLWQPPGRYEDRATDRRVTFLELFFDLVFVVVISQLAHRLAAHPSWSGVGWFVFLFYAVWSSWLNGTLYHDLHTTNDLSVRVFTFGADARRRGHGGVHRGRAGGRIDRVRARLRGEHPHPGDPVVPYRAARPAPPARVVPVLRRLLRRRRPVRGQRRVRRAAAVLAVGAGAGRRGGGVGDRHVSMEATRDPGGRCAHLDDAVADRTDGPVRDHRPRRGHRGGGDRHGRRPSARGRRAS